jgi:hypothetical protein
LSADEIDDEVFQWIVEQAVDGKVASLGILFGGSEFDPIRTSSVGVGTIGAESGHFDLAFLFRDSAMDKDHAEGFTDRLGMGFAEGTADLLGRSVGSDIEVFGLDSQESVANATASVIGDKTAFVQPSDEFMCELPFDRASLKKWGWMGHLRYEQISSAGAKLGEPGGVDHRRWYQ